MCKNISSSNVPVLDLALFASNNLRIFSKSFGIHFLNSSRQLSTNDAGTTSKILYTAVTIIRENGRMWGKGLMVDKNGVAVYRQAGLEGRRRVRFQSRRKGRKDGR